MRQNFSAIINHTAVKQMIRREVSLTAYIAVFILFWFPLSSSALESDRTKPIEVSADQAVLDDKKSVAIYEGNVILTQGTLSIKADKLTIQANSDGQVEEVIATGQLAEFTQKPDPDKQPVIAKAKRINYLVEKEKIILTHSASVVQNQNLFQGSTITYDIREQKLKASGPTRTDALEEGSGRVKMILPPPSSKQKQPTELQTPPKNTTENNSTDEQTNSVSFSKELQE